MTTTPARRQNLNPPDRNDVVLYAVLSLGGFICGLVILALLVWKADKLVALGLIGNLYYLALLPLGLSAAAFLFGAMHGFALYSGKQFSGILELGGPIVGFLLVLILGFWLPAPASNIPFTVYVHGAPGASGFTASQ